MARMTLDKKVYNEIGNIRRKIGKSNMRKVMGKVGKLALDIIEERFEHMYYHPGKPWKPLKRPRPSPYGRWHTLSKTGKLRNSMQMTHTATTVVVKTKVHYAKYHDSPKKSIRGGLPRRQFMGLTSANKVAIKRMMMMEILNTRR